ncbi:MAG: rod shape-determining protein MreD [SAR116 cluster bacterium]|nr:rod shape-determining protein MreD [SAR116 cluster bacterium]RPG99916.1 MAG: rod shape-determining protein MreD [Candidatus Puniceispirillum sp. TMED176]|tara:strand:+ start:1573 stop:2112 length:540 start_codon:yes stop_codon:yes gene_type:complete
MSRRGRFFQKAELESDWPFQFLVVIVGMVLAMAEGGLALWPVFYGATPMLSLIFLYWIALHHEKYVLLVTGFLIGLTSDILFSDLLGGRATAYIVVLFAMNWRRQKLLQGDFRDIWVEFAVTVFGVVLFQMVIFSALNLAIPALTPVIFQIGVTMILFPIGYVILSTLYFAFNKIRLST